MPAIPWVGSSVNPTMAMIDHGEIPLEPAMAITGNEEIPLRPPTVISRPRGIPVAPAIAMAEHHHDGGTLVPVAAATNIIGMTASQGTSVAPPMNIKMPDPGGMPVTPPIAMTDHGGISVLPATAMTSPEGMPVVPVITTTDHGGTQ